ncbi:MAG: putative transport system permease protein [Acidimicrobiaceae bacterium]|jgi:putative ABC transport system permease protein
MHLRQLRRQPLRAALAVLAIGAGVTLTVAVLVAQSSLDRSFTAYNATIGGSATLRVVSRFDHGGIDASTFAAIEKVDGVQTAVPLVLTVTQVSDDRGHDELVAVIGADCRAEALFGSRGCDPAALANLTDANPPAIGSGVRAAAGPTGLLRTDFGDRSLENAPVVTDFDNVNGGRVVLYPLSVAQALFARPNGLDAIFIVPRPGVATGQLQATLADEVGPQNKVLLATEPGSNVAFVSSQLLPFLFLISLFGLAVGGQLVFNTMTLSLEERRREMAIASALGGTPGTVTLGVLAEAAVLGLAGGAVGIGMGLLVARPFVANFSKFAEQAAGIHLSVHPTVASTVIGLAIGVFASVAAAFLPARRAAKLDIAGELVDRSRRHDASTRIRARRAVILAVMTAGGLLMAWLGARDGGLESWQPNVLLIGVILSFTCAFPLPPAFAPFAVRWIEKIPVLQRGPARVAVSNLVTETRRTSAVLTAIGAAVGMAFTLGGVLPGMTVGAEQLARATSADRVTIATMGLNNTSAIDAKVSPDVQSALAQVPGVAAVEREYFAAIDMAGVGPAAITMNDGQPNHFKVYQGVDVEAALRQGQVMIGPGLARALDLRPGSTFDLPGRFGIVPLTVGGIWADPDSLGHGIYASKAVFERVVGARPVGRVLLVPEPGLSPSALAETVRAARIAPNLKVFDPDQVAESFASDFRVFLAPFWLLARGLLVVAFIATASTLLLAGVKRRAEHGLLAAVGMPPGDLGRMVLVEAGLFGLIGTICGFIGGLIGLATFSLASTSLTGLTIPFRVSFGPLFLYGFIATVCVLAGAALPAWRTSRLDPVVALRYE